MSTDRAFRISNRLATAVLLIGWVALLLRSSEPANRVVLDRYSNFAFAVVVGWGVLLVVYFAVSRYTRIGRKVFGPDFWLAVASMIFALGIAEVAARALWPPRSNALINYLQVDPDLGINRLDPITPGHDAHGFRNAVVPAKVDILFIGDSQTYGNGVTREETFASRIRGLTGRSTYNLSLGGWGPIEYHWALAEFGPRLGPDVVVTSVYLGNDLFDTMTMAGRAEAIGLPPAPNGDGVWLRSLYGEFSEQLKRSTPAARKIEGTLNRIRLWDVTTRTFGVTFESYSFYDLWGKRYAADRNGRTDHWILRESPYFAYAGDPLRTIFTPSARFFAVAPEVEPAIGYAATILSRSRDLAVEMDAAFVVAIIPTKEEVYAPRLMARNVPLPPAYVALLERTEVVRNQLRATIEERGLVWIDLLPAFQEATRRGERLYLKGRSGHPNSAGHRVIAEALVAELFP